MEQQQQQQQQIHRRVLAGIARLEDPRYRQERHNLRIDCSTGIDWHTPADRQSLQYMVDFLDNGDDSHEVVITELELYHVGLSRPSDGGLDVLRDFFARSDSTLTKVTLRFCNFGRAEDASHLLTAFQTNRTVTDLTIRRIRNLEGTALGACVSGLMQSMPQLQRLDCTYSYLRLEGVRACLPALQANRTLKELGLYSCDIGDEGVRFLADALVGNTTMDELCMSYNDITSAALDDITRLLESMQLKKIVLRHNNRVFGNEASTQRFTRVLSRHEFLKELNLSHCELGDGGIRIIADGLVGNTTMEILNISHNDISSNGLDDITRLLETTQLKTIYCCGGRHVRLFHDVDATQHFVTTLQHKNSSVQELPMIRQHHFPGDEDSKIATFASINNSLTRNQQLNHVNLLLAPPPQQQQQQRNSGTTILKTWHKAITKFAMVPNNAGASAIFKLFTARPQLLEKRLKRPAFTVAVAAAAAVSKDQHPCADDDKAALEASANGGHKRRRVY